MIPCPTARLGLPCSGNGKCDDTIGKCTCETHWAGVDCAYREMKCPLCGSNGRTCGGHGVCDFTVGKCRCDYDYGGDAALRICRIESDAEQAVREAKYEQERIESVDRHRREKAASELKLLAELKAKYEA